MKFGSVAVVASEGAILAHAIRGPGVNLKKGQVIGPAQIATLVAAGIDEIVCALLDRDDVHENVAARQIAARISGAHVRFEAPFTGRCNLVAEAAGLVCVNREMIDAINAEDEAITVATVGKLHPVLDGDLIGAVKVIPFAVPHATLATSLAGAPTPAVSIAPFQPLRVGVISTLLPGLKRTVIDKTIAHLEDRLSPAKAAIVREHRVMHTAEALAAAIGAMRSMGVDLLIIFGATAITDRRDVVPIGVQLAGGLVEHLGLPVDPGNLLLLGRIALDGETVIPIVGAPGCARSTNECSFDIVLRHLLAGLEVTGRSLRRMGVGGMLNVVATKAQSDKAQQPVLQTAE